ncbi:hypothetical protein [Thermocrinis sp.]
MFASVQFKLEFENKVALVLPLLGGAFTRDFSSLPPLLVEGKWKSLTAGLVPSGFGGLCPGRILGE